MGSSRSTPGRFKSSVIFIAVVFGCGSDPSAMAEPPETKAKSAAPAPDPRSGPNPRSEPNLGVRDTGVFSDLDKKIQLPKPAKGLKLRGVLDKKRGLLTIYERSWPTKVYPLRSGAEATKLRLGSESIGLRAGDAAELRPLASDLAISTLGPGAKPPGGDADGDGIPDALDLLIGAKKTVVNAASYGAGYIRLPFPNGDVPRDVGVCTDVIIRAARNVGVDLQSEVNLDIKRRRRAYPMVKRPNAHIDHRRVKTLLPYFRRHWAARDKALANSRDPLLPGDVIFMDTFPSRSGPDHIGIISNKRGPSGHPLVINNWTDGSVTNEMDLLAFVPVTHRFRLKSAR